MKDQHNPIVFLFHSSGLRWVHHHKLYSLTNERTVIQGKTAGLLQSGYGCRLHWYRNLQKELPQPCRGWAALLYELLPQAVYFQGYPIPPSCFGYPIRRDEIFIMLPLTCFDSIAYHPVLQRRLHVGYCQSHIFHALHWKRKYRLQIQLNRMTRLQEFSLNFIGNG